MKQMRQPETSAIGEIYPDNLSRLTIRHLVKEDLLALEWGGEYTHFRRLYAQAYERARQKKSILWVAEMSDYGIIGQIFVQLISKGARAFGRTNRGYIYSFRVRPTLRNLGIGTRLLDVVESDLVGRHIYQAALNVARDNPSARRLYERRGYRVVGEEPGIWQYMDHTGVLRTVREPAWRMEKRLD